MMPSDWKIRPLGEVSINLDHRRKPVKQADRVAGPYPYFGASGIVDCVDSYLFDGEYVLVAEDGENLRTRKTPIAFMASGKFWVNNHAHILQGNQDANTRFLAYALEASDISGYLSGSTMPKLTQGNLNQITLLVPPLAEQEAIVEILGALDDKIDLNRKMNATLDELARTIFRSWFVDFDPVRAKLEGRQPFGMDAETAALFPDRFVESSLGPIPDGWEVRALQDAIELNPRRTLKQGTDATFLEMKNVATSGHRPLGLEKRPAKGGARFSQGDTLLARITPCLENGKTAFVDFLDADEVGFGSTEYIVMRAKEPLPAIWSYLVARNEAFRAFAIQNMTGTSGRQRVSADSLGQYPLVTPSDSLARVFGESVQPYFDLIRHNDEESQTLAELRDTLLPELISGRIRVPDAEKAVAEVV